MHRSIALIVAATLAFAATGCNFGQTTATGNDSGIGFETGPAPVFDAGPGVDAPSSHDAAPGVDATPEAEAGPTAKLTAATSTGATTADFGTLEVGKASASVSVVVSNGGAGTTSSLTVTLGTTDASSFSIDSDGCTGKTLAPSTTCSVSVHFTPAAAGTLSDTLDVGASDGGQVGITLTGQGVTPGALSVSPASQDFGTVTTGNTSSATTFTVTNTGQSATAAITMSTTGSSASAFVIPQAQDTCTGQTLAGGATCTLAVTFAPATAGTFSAALAAAAGTSTATSSLSGTGVGPAVFTVTPAPFDFGSVVQGTSSAPQSFTVQNAGGTASDTPQVALSGGNAADFGTSASTCNGGLTPGATCTFSVTFTPSTTAGEGTTIDVTGTATTAGTATLTGTGLTPPTPPTLAIAPGTGFSGSFGTVGVGKTAQANMTLRNTGQVTTPAAPTIVSANPDFTISPGTPPCNAALAGGASCGFVVTFSPSASASAESSLITASAPQSTSGTYTVSGTGATPTLAISPPASWPGFGTVEVGSTATATFTVTNTGPVATDTAPAVQSSNPDFAVSAGSPPCNAPLLVNATCDFVVTFAPKSTVTNDASTLTASVTPGTAGTYTVSGSGAVPTLVVTALSSTAFGFVTVGQSASLSFQVQNTGSVTSSGLTVSTSNNDFTPSTTCDATVLGPGATCDFDVVFKPSSSASPESSVITATPAVGNAGTITVTGQGGVGVLSAIAAWIAPATAQGSANQTTYTIANNGHGSTGPLTVTPPAASSAFNLQADTCNGTTLAAGQKCAITVNFSPTTTNSTPATTASATLTVTDSASDTESAGLSGLVLSATAYVVFSPSPASYGTVVAGSSGNYLTLTGTNYSTQQAVIGQVQILNVAGYRIGTLAGSTCVNGTVAAYGQSGDTCSHTLSLTAAGPTTSLPANAGVQADNANATPIGPIDTVQASW